VNKVQTKLMVVGLVEKIFLPPFSDGGGAGRKNLPPPHFLMEVGMVEKIFLPPFSASRMFVIVYTGLCPEPA